MGIMKEQAFCNPGTKTVYVQPGEVYVSSQDECISTVLGSCVSVCMIDKVKMIGGMNHIMLPQQKNTNNHSSFIASQEGRYGMAAMERLINEIIKKGGKKNQLEAKVFGGAKMFDFNFSTNIGQSNVDFVLWFLKNEGIKITAQDVGGTSSRRIFFNPADNKVLVKQISTSKTIVQAEQNLLKNVNQNAKPKPSVQSEFTVF